LSETFLDLSLESVLESGLGGMASFEWLVDCLGGTAVVMLGGLSGRHGATSLETKGNI
jgi:hypothetical protein